MIPEDGSHPEVELYGLHIRVEELTDRRVEWATVTKLAPLNRRRTPNKRSNKIPGIPMGFRGDFAF